MAMASPSLALRTTCRKDIVRIVLDRCSNGTPEAAPQALACLDCALRAPPRKADHAPALGRAAGLGSAPMGVDAVSDCGLDSDPPAMNLGAGAALTIRAAAGPAPALLLLLHGKALDGTAAC
ncbi:MAG: hypothetical protein FRX49_01887 [Trebouxia sp. A1-2]|nr:MAG: hypothetical protein FRX49_01887 [Trebouxia sp. A1-2]